MDSKELKEYHKCNELNIACLILLNIDTISQGQPSALVSQDKLIEQIKFQRQDWRISSKKVINVCNKIFNQGILQQGTNPDGKIYWGSNNKRARSTSPYKKTKWID